MKMQAAGIEETRNWYIIVTISFLRYEQGFYVKMQAAGAWSLEETRGWHIVTISCLRHCSQHGQVMARRGQQDRSKGVAPP